jgi:hypothetical protein
MAQTTVPVAYAVPVANTLSGSSPVSQSVQVAIPVSHSSPVAHSSPVSKNTELQDLSDKEWLQKYHPGRYEFKEEDMKGFPYSVQIFIRTWTKVDDSYLFFKSNIPYDDANKKAAAVLDVRGTDAAVQYMMSMANGSYSQMRSMYG